MRTRAIEPTQLLPNDAARLEVDQQECPLSEVMSGKLGGLLGSIAAKHKAACVRTHPSVTRSKAPSLLSANLSDQPDVQFIGNTP